MVRAPAAVFEVHGPGALQCLQGLLSNDLVAPGDGSMVYSALLTPKGMITADMWVLRLTPQRLLLIADASARGSTLGVFSRSMPARMALVDDRSREREVLWLCGDLAIAALAAAGFTVPDGEVKVIASEQGDEELLVARPHAGAHFRALLVASPKALDRAVEGLALAGVIPGDIDDLEAARILAGWPRLGAEIQDKTLPQEVRYDALQGVSYTKGCYLGQETVARLHFRGHTNRELRGLIWHGVPALEDDTVLGNEGQDVGTIGSLLVLPKVTVGLAVLRREVHPGDVVSTGGQYARVVPLPFGTLASYG
jgi:folate-binding protein YgfZ